MAYPATCKAARLRVLVDMDGVLADFETHFLTKYQEQYPGSPHIELTNRVGLSLRNQYGKTFDAKCEAMCHSIYTAPGFFADLPPIDGAIQSMNELVSYTNVDVYIATSPLERFENCVLEKYQWVEKHLGRSWTRKIILSSDKTVLNGHILIDDKPDITGVVKEPLWKHVLFAACHNQHVIHHDADYRIQSWTNGEWRHLIHREIAKHSSN